jgi:hypothetical protein
MPPRTPNQLIRWPFYSGIAVSAVTSISILLWPSLLFATFFLCLFLPIVVALLGVTIWFAAVALFRRQQRRALSMMAFPLMVAITVPAMEVMRSARDELRFLVHKGGYDALVAKTKTEGKQYIVVHDWSIFANSFVV